MLSEVLDYAVTVDQLDIVNLVSFEMLVRFMQHQEAEVKKKMESRKEFDSGIYYLGRNRKTAGTLICPALVEFAAKRASEGYQILKEQRKAAEERKMAKK